jgi:hypothetical protein
MLIPESMKTIIDQFYDNLCRVLTDWEQGEIDDFELYDFMVEVANDITGIAYDD